MIYSINSSMSRGFDSNLIMKPYMIYYTKSGLSGQRTGQRNGSKA
jgi:hypothetical protein